MSVKYLDNAGTQYLVNKIKAIDGKIPTESQITTMITNALNTYKEGIVTIVESLPQTGEEGKLYLLIDPSDTDVYIVYTWEENAFKRMGSKTFTLTVDSALSSTSTNPVQNKVVKTALDGKANSSHTHGSITNDGKLATASRVVITGTDKKIGVSTVTTTQLGYLSGVTSAIQTQLDGKSPTGHTHTAGDVAGLATVATSGSYNDLSNKPSIPTKTSDLTNDSNFVDTSNTAVSSGITSAKVTAYDSHIADTDIHVTSSDKTTWNAVTSKADDSDVVHKSGNEYITDTKTFGKGTLIVDNSVGSNVHGEIKLNGSRSGYIVADNSGDGVFENSSCGISILLQDAGKPLHVGSYKVDSNGRVFVDNTNKNPVLTVKGGLIKSSILIPENDTSDNAFIISSELSYANSDSSKALNVVFRQYDDANATSAIYSNTNNVTSLGIPTRKWSKIYGTEYYYGSNNVEFSNKFVTTDTAQTIAGDKVWTGTNTFQQNVTYQRTNFFHQASGPCYILKDTNLEKGSLVASSQASYPGLWQDKNNNVLGYMRFVEYSSGRQTAEFRISNLIKNGALDPTGSEVNCTVLLELQPSGEKSLIPEQNNDINLGTSANKWKSFNGLTPSSLSMPSDRSARVDISSYITNLGSGGNNVYIVPANGYIWLHFTSVNNVLCFSQTSGGLTNYAQTFSRYSGDGVLYAFFPVRKDDYFIVQIYTSSTAVVQNAYFIPCQGNV